MEIQPTTLRAFCASALISVAALMSGCASIVHGGPRTITVNSQPAGAKATITRNGMGTTVHSGVTPFTVALDPRGGYFRGQSYSVRFELAGYTTDEVTIRAELSGWYWGNIVFGGLIGLIAVDPATGSMWNLAPDKLHRTLTPQQAGTPESGPGFVVALVSELSEEQRAAMVRIR
jgi:uncharacterized protein YceK